MVSEIVNPHLLVDDFDERLEESRLRPTVLIETVKDQLLVIRVREVFIHCQDGFDNVGESSGVNKVVILEAKASSAMVEIFGGCFHHS